MELEPAHRGIGWYPPAYRIILDNDPHAPGSVDRVLVDSMVRLCPETAPFLYSGFTPTRPDYAAGSRPALERIVEGFGIEPQNDERWVEGISRYASELGSRVATGIETLRFGGTGEEIIARGSNWCTDVARVACALYQVSGLAARLIYLADLQQAYSGHTIVEVLRGDRWGAIDVVSGVVYRSPDRRPASAWELMTHPGLVDGHYRDDSTHYARHERFSAAGIANYPLGERTVGDYSVSSVNPYYRAVLENSDRCWPGGLRWIFGEDRAGVAPPTDIVAPRAAGPESVRAVTDLGPTR